SDPDGSISNYAWTKTSGPSTYSIVSSAAASTEVNDLEEGIYVFTLQVTDNAGATASSTVTITVSAAMAQRPLANQPPVANAGGNLAITVPANKIILNGSASNDPDGSIVSYSWTKTSGPATYTMADAAAANTSVNNLVEGVYLFTLQVTDNAGATASSSVTVTVNRAPNQAPAARAGFDVEITLPVNSSDLDGTSSYDPDGTIAGYSWNKLSGPGATTIVNSNTPTPTVIGLSEGQYLFELTVTDNEGAISTDQVIVNVHPQPNKAPVADAGKDTSIALPVSSTILSGTNSADADGTITTYGWKQISGPSAAVIVHPAQGLTEVDSLMEGDYVFELQVTDNAGATATARVKLTVLNNFRYSQFFKLYPNPATSTINLQFIDDKTGKLGIVAYDVNGRLVMSEEFSKSQSLITKEINVSQLKPGVYYLELRHSDGTKLIRPFVKQ
ncbi:MAG: PKD domain-containing protein, partial [Bacteroidota bacterium]